MEEACGRTLVAERKIDSRADDGKGKMGGEWFVGGGGVEKV